jgi:dTDP-glucose pyrophosphorylase
MSSSLVPQICITMAGFGRRFLEAGYTLPKYRISVHGRHLFAWSMASLMQFIKQGAPCCFIVRRADESASFIRAEVERLGIAAWTLVEIDGPTDGQATTALLAEPSQERERAFLVYNIDTFVEPWALPADAPHGDGWLPCFPAVGEAWSFARAGADGCITEVREKRRISSHATIGLYWFRSFALYQDVYRRYYSDGQNNEAGERYIAPVYNRLIRDGGNVYIHNVPAEAVHPLGTPAEVEAFRRGDSPLTGDDWSVRG